MSVSVKLNLNHLHHLASRVQPDVIDQGASDWADAVVEKAQELVPVDEGDLQSTIRKEKGERAGVYQVVAGGKSGPNKYVDYARFVEYGTGRGPAQPYLTPAWRQVRGLPFFQRLLRELIR